MSIEDNLNKPLEWSNAALQRMQQDGLPPLPDNYAVYYAYFAGTHPNLTVAVDVLFAEYGKLTQQVCSELFRAYLSLEAENKVLDTATNSIETELERVMEAITKTQSGMTDYNQKLDTFAGDLGTGLSMEQIRSAVTRIAMETRVIADQNQRLNTQLAQSTQQLTEVRSDLDQVRKDSLIDPLTEIGNRKFFEGELLRASHEALENSVPLALLMVDIDYFKKFNDTYGHLVGDQVLRLVARTMIENLKGRDIIARFGGEEFVILLPQTGLAGAEKVGNLLRTSLSTKQVRRKSSQETLGIVTISIGAAEYIPHEPLDDLIARADAALYDAKQGGRNKVMTRPPLDLSAASSIY